MTRNCRKRDNKKKSKKKRRIWKLQYLSDSMLGDTKTKQPYNLVDETCGGWIFPVRDGRELVKYCDMISLVLCHQRQQILWLAH